MASRVNELLAPGGALGRRWPRFESRPAQLQMARDVAGTIERGGILLAEAPTGVGKSLAYLLPAALHVVERGARVVVATATRSLQDQLVERDLPALEKATGLRIPHARLKGKANYVCPRALLTAVAHGAEERALLEELRAWAASDPRGDLDTFPASDPEAFRRVRPRVAADPLACAGSTCRRGGDCFWVRARRAAGDAGIVVVNHAILALSGRADGLVPDHDVLIVDEAHRLEGMLLMQLERGLSRRRFDDAVDAIGGPRSARGLAARIRRLGLPLFGASPAALERLDALQHRATAVRSDADAFFARVDPGQAEARLYAGRRRYRAAEELLGRDLQLLETLLEHAHAYTGALVHIARVLDGQAATSSTAQELIAELELAAARWALLGDDARALGMAEDRDWVYWVSSGRRGVELRGSPVDAGTFARGQLFSRARACVLTSATLSAGGDFAFTAERLGVGEEASAPHAIACYDSPFALARQVRVFVYGGSEGSEADAVADVVVALAHQAPRNQLVLFTAHERLRAARERLRERLPRDTLLLAQEWDGGAAAVGERFRRARGAVLLGVQSFWEGVDFPGEELEVLVMAKLPFSVPDDPLVEARAERLRDAGRDAFREDAVPEAVLRFRQGVGRLIRRADDRGVVVVCDPRLLTARYRAPFLAALPVEPERVARASDLAERAGQFLASHPAAAEPSA